MKSFKMRLDSIQYSARQTNIYTFVPVDGAALSPASAGSHIDLYLRPDLIRQYSLMETSADPRAYVVAIKKEASGRGGSRHVHEMLRVGDEIMVGEPRNNFPLVEDAPHSVLIAGGIGITPIWAMARRLTELGRDWRLFVSNRNRDEAPLLGQLNACGKAMLHFDDEAGGFADLDAIIAGAPQGTHFYCCGPAPMLAAYRTATAHLPPDHVHLEAFGAEPVSSEDDGEFIVRLAKSGTEFAIPAGQTILDVLRDHGIELVSSCEAGVCGMCETRVLEGKVDHRDHVLAPDQQALNDRMMICCSRAATDRLILDL